MSISSAPRQLMRREERVESILTGAARAFGRTGFAATSMDDIAAEAGITKLILYRHFEGKKDIYEAVLARVSERLIEAFVASRRGHKPVAGMAALLTAARADPDAFLLLFRHAAREPEFAAYTTGFVERVMAAAEVWLSDRIADQMLKRWMARVSVRSGIEAVIAWIEVGTEDRDVEFLQRAEAAITALVRAGCA